MLVLVPCYEPGEALVDLVEQLRSVLPDAPVLLVDDGSGPCFAETFERATACGAIVVRHAVNLGKGAALKTGFAVASQRFPGQAVVCSDCDGQHRVDDIVAVAGAAASADIALGMRRFEGDVPLKSRVGNTLTRSLFGCIAGRRIFDTQTGLRAYPAARLEWLEQIKGDRFEYELNVLLQACAEQFSIAEVPIATVYVDGNASSHFRPFVDSIRVYAPLMRHGSAVLGARLRSIAW